MVKNLIIFVCFFMFSLIDGCNPPKDFVEFYNLPGEKQQEILLKLPLDKQIDYHLYAMAREPPDSRFAEDIASQGDKIIPDVLQRLKSEPYAKAGIMEIFYALCLHKNCKETQPELVKQLEAEVNRMPDGTQHDLAKIILSGIKDEPRAVPTLPSND